jgi:hypothetical protein
MPDASVSTHIVALKRLDTQAYASRAKSRIGFRDDRILAEAQKAGRRGAEFAEVLQELRKVI